MLILQSLSFEEMRVVHLVKLQNILKCSIWTFNVACHALKTTNQKAFLSHAS